MTQSSIDKCGKMCIMIYTNVCSIARRCIMRDCEVAKLILSLNDKQVSEFTALLKRSLQTGEAFPLPCLADLPATNESIPIAPAASDLK